MSQQILCVMIIGVHIEVSFSNRKDVLTASSIMCGI